MIKKYLTLYLCVILGTLTFFTQAFAQQVFKTTPTSVIGYLEYLPDDYNSNSDKYPVVIFLHGKGEKGPTSNDPDVLIGGVAALTRLGPPKHVKNGTKFPFILISPQLKSSYGDWPTDYVMEVIDHCKTYLRIDERRIYITGLSLGGGGTWWTSQDKTQMFAAVAPVCGSRNSPTKAYLYAQESCPVWAFHGDKDGTVPLLRSVLMINAINACSPAPNPKAKLTIYPGVNHNAWDNAYKPDHTVHNPNVYEWMLSFTNTRNGSNKIPLANAGADIVKTLPANSATLQGSGSDDGGSISSYAWKQVSGPSQATLSNASGSSTTVSNLVAGVYTFRLKVTDNGGETDSDYVKVTVKGDGGGDKPVANAGPDKTITLPTNSVVLGGTAGTAGVTATTGDGNTYAWTKVSGGDATLSGETTPQLTATQLKEGAYVFRLTIKNSAGATASDDVAVTVNPAANKPPVANAGPDKTLTLPSNATTLTGGGTDPDGTIASYSWVKVSGGAATLNGVSTAKLAVSKLVAGAYVFRLTVKDNKGATHSDQVNVTVKPATSSPPVANAGVDRMIRLPAPSVTIVGSGSAPGSTIKSYQWTQVSGPACTIVSGNTSRMKIAGFSTGTRVFRLKVTNAQGKTDVDDVMVKFDYPPTAEAGPNATVKLPKNSIVLNGSGFDQDGSITYQWSRVAGPPASLSNTTTKSLSVSGLISGVYIFKLIVRDNMGLQAVDYTTVTVQPSTTITTASTAGRVSTTSTESTAEAPEATSQKFDLSDPNTALLKDYQVVVFNDRGEKLYAGRWEGSSYQLVFANRGLYFYNVLKDNKGVDSGKIYIKD